MNYSTNTRIRKLKLKLQHKIDIAIANWGNNDTPEVHELQKRVFFVHAMVDRQLSLHCMDFLFRTITPENVDYGKLTEKDFAKWSTVIGGIMEAMEELKFKQKLVFCKKLGAVNNNLFKTLDDFNRIRNEMAHPSTGETNKPHKYSSDDTYIQALRITSDAADFCKNFGFPWFDELDEMHKKALSKNQ